MEEREYVVANIIADSIVDYMVEPVKLIASKNVDIVSAIFQVNPEQQLVRVTFLLDLTRSKINVKELSSEIAKIKHVRQVEVSHALPLGIREGLVAYTKEMLAYMFKLFGELGSGGEALAYHMGYEAGETAAKRMKAHFKNNEEVMNTWLLNLECLGHGRFELKDYAEGKHCTVIAEEYAGAIEVDGLRIGCNMLRGIFAGLASELWKVKVRVNEIRCGTKGDPCCEYVIEAES